MIGWEAALHSELEFDRLQRVVLPAGEKRMALEHELALGRHRQPAATVWPAPARWLGGRLVRLGAWLGAEPAA